MEEEMNKIIKKLAFSDFQVDRIIQLYKALGYACLTKTYSQRVGGNVIVDITLIRNTEIKRGSDDPRSH